MKYKDFFDLVESDEDVVSVFDDELGLNEEEEIVDEEREESIFETWVFWIIFYIVGWSCLFIYVYL